MPEYIETIKAIHEKISLFKAAVGHSFGGMTILNFQAEKSVFKNIITIGSTNLVSRIIKQFINNLTLKPVITTKMQRSIEKKWKIEVDDYASSYAVKKIEISTLIVHDTKDRDVPVSCAEEIRQNLKNGTLLITHGLGHTKILRDKKTMNKVVEFIIKNT